MIRSTRATVGGLIAIVLWSTTIAVMRSLTEQLGTRTAAASVFLLGGMLCLAIARLGGVPLASHARVPWRYLVGCGALFVFYQTALVSAIGVASDRDQILEIGLINYLWPTLTILFTILLLGKRARWFLLPATLVALAGLFLVLSHDASVTWATVRSHVRSNPAAYFPAFGAAIAWGLYSALARRWGGSEGRGSVGLFLLASGTILLALRVAAPEEGAWSGRAAAEVVFMASATALAYFLWDVAMRRGDVVLVASASYLTPLLSTIVSVAYLGASAGERLWWGCGLLIAGAFGSRAAVRDPDRKKT